MKNLIAIFFYLVHFSSLCGGLAGQEGNVAQNPAPFAGQDLFVGGENQVHTYRIPAMITTHSGAVIALCDARVDKGNDAPNNIDLVMRISYDSGRTWSKAQVIADFPGDECAGDASLVVDEQTGTIWLAYDYAVPDPQGYFDRILRIHLIKSEDEGHTWSPPVDLSCLTKGMDFWLQNGPGRGLFVDGTIIFPMYACAKGKGQQSRLVYSRDHGKTWRLSAGVGDSDVEPQIVALSKGRIMANMRRPGGYRQVAVTSDLGSTWQETYTDSTLIDPGCQASLINYRFRNKSLLVFANAADRGKRQNMVIRTSPDEGKSWPKQISIYDGTVAYSCLTQLPNGNLGLLYEADRYKRIIFAEIPYEAL